MNGKSLGRLVLKQGKLYDFNLDTKGGAEDSDGQEFDANGNALLVDLKIDGKRGPIPKIVDSSEVEK